MGKAKKHRQSTKKPLIAVVEGYGAGRPLEVAGALTFTIDSKHDAEVSLDKVDGVLFTGGSDLNPELYGVHEDDIHPEVYGINHRRDDLETYIIKEAMERKLAIMGICRGSQLINVAHGGTLHQHLPYVNDEDHWGHEHNVKLSRRSALVKFLPKPYLFRVSSFHHQAVNHIGDGLMPIGWAHDGTIEAIETMPQMEHYALGVQFHPEMDYRTDEDALTIFEYFIAQARGRCSDKRSANKRHDAIMEKVFDTYKGSYSYKNYGSYAVTGGESIGHLNSGYSTRFSDDSTADDTLLWTPEERERYWWGDDDVDDTEEYFEWLRINDIGLSANHNIRRSQTECDSICTFPPCTNPDSCGPDVGDCFRLQVAAQSQGVTPASITEPKIERGEVVLVGPGKVGIVPFKKPEEEITCMVDGTPARIQRIGGASK